MKPLIKYRGAKSKEIPNIEKQIPQFTGRYIEPFFGGGALYFHLEPQKAIINDINSKLLASIMVLRTIILIFAEKISYVLVDVLLKKMIP